MGQTLAQVPRDDTLNPLVDLLHAFLGANTQPGSSQQAKAERRQETERERLSDHLRDLSHLVDVPADHQHLAGLQASSDGSDQQINGICLRGSRNSDALDRPIDPERAWNSLKIAGKSVSIRLEQPRKLDASGILRENPTLGRQGRNEIDLLRDHAVGSRDQVAIALPVDKSEQDDDEGCQYACNGGSPPEGIRSYEQQLRH